MKTKNQRAEYIQGKLDELYPEIPIPLDHTDAYTLLIAVLLSAQCTDKRVNMVTPALFAKASTPQEMAKLSDAGRRHMRPSVTGIAVRVVLMSTRPARG